MLQAPGSEFVPIATRTPSVFPVRERPNAGIPTMLAAPAPYVVNANPSFHEFAESAVMRNPGFAYTALRANDLHFLYDLSDRTRGDSLAMYDCTYAAKEASKRSTTEWPRRMFSPETDTTGRSSLVVDVMKTSSADSRSAGNNVFS